MERQELIDIDVPAMRGLEIGPLANPVVRKDEGTVFYVDHTSAEGLRQKYASDHLMRERLADIVEVDYIVPEGSSLSDAVKADAPFDYIIAAHLIEHIPDVISWLLDVATVLRPAGILSLVVPDKRYCFDINRTPTEISDLVDAYLRKLSRPSYKQMYDFFSKAINGVVDTAAVWAGTADYSNVTRSDCVNPDAAALSVCETLLQSDEFVDAHCHVFTPDSFLTIIEKLSLLDLIDFELSYLIPTEVNRLEFYVSLRRLDDDQPRDLQQDRQLAAIDRARAQLKAESPDEKPSEPVPPQPDLHDSVETNDDRLMILSDRERRLILTKRTVLKKIRDFARQRST